MNPPIKTNEPAKDDSNPWDMPGHSHGEKFAVWTTLTIVIGLIFVVVIIDLYRKQGGREPITKRWLIRLWNLTFGRIARLRIDKPEGDGAYRDLEKGAGKGSKGKNNESGSEDEDNGAKKARSGQPQILITKPDPVLLDSSPMFTSNPFSSPSSSSSRLASRVSDEGPGPAPGSMLGPISSIFKEHPVHSHTRHGSHDSTNSQQSGERRVAQPIPGQLLVGRQI